MLSRKEIEKNAELAKIKISSDKFDKLKDDISRIVDFVGELAEVDLPAAEAGEAVMGIENRFQDDREHGLVEEKGEELIRQAPKKKDNLVEVPKVLKEAD